VPHPCRVLCGEGGDFDFQLHGVVNQLTQQ
jgi:hypothetical protein